MTTIAIDALGNIAADGRRTAGNEIIRYDAEKIKVSHGRIYALTGCCSLLDALISWHHAGADASKMPTYKGDGGWYLIVFQADGMYTYSNDVPYSMGDEIKAPMAFGSGQNWAMGAMLAGKSAKEAVEIACKVDIYSGGQIKVMNIADTLAPKLKEAAE